MIAIFSLSQFLLAKAHSLVGDQFGYTCPQDTSNFYQLSYIKQAGEMELNILWVTVQSCRHASTHHTDNLSIP